jgi:hypothetical protein
MKELEKGNKRLVAELSLEQQGLKDVVSGNCYARSGVDFRIPTSRFQYRWNHSRQLVHRVIRFKWSSEPCWLRNFL